MEGFSAIRTTPRRRQARDWSLVLSSQGLAHAIDEGQGEWTLFVAESDVLPALRELELYEQENRAWPWVEELPLVSGASWTLVLGWTLLLTAFDLLARANAWGRDWFALGRADSTRMLEGEYWRALTALTLHSGLGHLMSNALWGALFLALAGETMGAGVAALLAVASGALGNALNAVWQGEGHASLGASTAVFGVLGVLAGSRFRARSKRRSRWFRRVAPVVAALFLFLFSGVGGTDPAAVLASRIDVEGHLGGFLCGLLLGAVCEPWAAPRQRRRGVQAALAAIALASLVLAWTWARAA